MKKIDFNRNWTCRCLTRDEEPYSVTLPHDAMRSEPRTAESVSEETPAGIWAAIMNTQNMFLYHQNTVEKSSY